jgi:glutamyl-Q tRNA(Asp) synthetase
MIESTPSAMPRCRGRFAPSPTGPLHFGSLVAALASFLDAKSRGGAWLVRIEDLDPPREMPGAAAAILRTLDACGLQWDGSVVYQSRRAEHYQAALDGLRRDGHVYACTCTRREIADSAITGIEGPVYPGTCRNRTIRATAPHASRARVAGAHIEFEDEVQGTVSQQLERDIGDFVLRRADGLFAYQLAVVVDDDDAGITRVTRGADLIDSTPRQIFLQRLLGMSTPDYLHVPVATNAAGDKLSKQTRARPIDEGNPSPVLTNALEFLGQHPPKDLAHTSTATVLGWALEHWLPAAIPRRRQLPVVAE